MWTKLKMHAVLHDIARPSIFKKYDVNDIWLMFAYYTVRVFSILKSMLTMIFDNFNILFLIVKN